MAKLQCRDYGFDCDFVVDGEVESVITQFGKHTNDEHGIEYSKEALMQIILRKSQKLMNNFLFILTNIHLWEISYLQFV